MCGLNSYAQKGHSDVTATQSWVYIYMHLADTFIQTVQLNYKNTNLN